MWALTACSDLVGMSFNVKAKEVQQATSHLRRATGELKGALTAALRDPCTDTEEALEASRTKVRDEVDTCAIMKRRALAKGLSVADLATAMSKAEMQLQAVAREVSPDPGRRSTRKAKGKAPANPRRSARTKGAKPEASATAEASAPATAGAPAPATAGARVGVAPQPSPGRGQKSPEPTPGPSRPATNPLATAGVEDLVTIDDDQVIISHPPSQGSQGSRESSLSLREELAKATRNEAIASARRKYLEERVAIQEERESEGRRSQALTSEPSEGQLPPGTQAQAKGKAQPKRARAKGQEAPPQIPERERDRDSQSRTSQWAQEAATRTRKGSIGALSDREDFIEALAEAMAKVKKTRGRRAHSDSAPEEASGSRESEDSPSSRGSSGRGRRAPLLEMIKVLERRRPSEKFDGTSRRVDFEDHMAQFEQAIDIPGLPARDKLSELKHWFAGLARVQTAKFHRMADHEAGLRKAVALLKEEYGQRDTSAEDMLADAMSKGVIAQKDAEGINVFVGKIEEVYALAAETDRDQDFHRTSLYRAILSECLPHLKQSWATHVEKKDLKKPKFEDFLKFLAVQRKIATRLSELNKESPKPAGKGPKEEPPKGELEEGWQTVTRPARKAQGAQTREMPKRAQTQSPRAPERGEGDKGPNTTGPSQPPPCPKCKGGHPLEFCAQFGQMAPKDRAAFVKERRKCVFCLKGGHTAGGCFSKVKCYSCLGDHHYLLHEGGAPKGDGAGQARPASA